MKIVTLDFYGLKPDFIKIDTEGFEGEVLDGAIETIRSSLPSILMELNGLSEKLYSISKGSIITKLLDLGYFVYKVNRNHVFRYQTLEQAEVSRFCDYLFLHPSKYECKFYYV